MKQKTPCPECDSPLTGDIEFIKGKIFTCSRCGCELEVLNDEPLVIAPLEEEK